MNDRTKDNPFTPGEGRTPLLLAGRKKEARIFNEMFEHLRAPRSETGSLQDAPFPPLRVTAPRGGGRRTLLSSLEQSARREGIRVARCSYPESRDRGGGVYEPLLAAMADEENGWMGKPARKLLRKWPGHADIRLHQANQDHVKVALHLMQNLSKQEPLLLIMDGVERYDPEEFKQFLLESRKPFRDNYSFALVLAGTPALDSYLSESDRGDGETCERIYLGPLSDDATWAALREPFAFSEANAWIRLEALDALVPQAKNYPLFIQLAGSVVWEAAMVADLKEIDVKLVKKCAGDIRKAKESFFASCHKRLEAKGLLLYAQPVMELLDGNGGNASAEELQEAIAKAKPRPKGDGKVEEICDGLHEESFIWTVYDEVRPGIPSLFDYIKARKR